MFKFDEICELIQLVSSTGVGSVEIEHAGARLRIDGPPALSVIEAPTTQLTPALQTEVATIPAGSTSDEEATADDVSAGDDKLHWVASPIVGTFYRAPNPDADPYVKVGDFVEQGQTLCIVEAMKLMNEIEADATGTVVKVLPENEQPVEYGQRLFGVRPN
jgi:acetyl-CoA carboxylase biotin carboxyl carrier protein